MAEEQQLPQTQAPEGHEETTPRRDLLERVLQALERWSWSPDPSPAPSETNAKPEEPAAGTAEEEGQGHDPPLPSMRVEGARQDPDQDPVARYRQKIEEFDAEREAPIGKVIRLLLLATGYVAPVCCAILLGWEFGEIFGKGDLFFSAAIHVLSLSIEMIIAGLALATAWSLKRLGADRRRMLSRFLLCGSLFLLSSFGSATALWWALSSFPIPPFVLAFRVIVPVLIEVGGMAIVATLDFQSLEAFLASLHQRAEAIQRLSEAELRLKGAEQEAINRQREYEEYRAMRARNEEVLLKMLEIQSRGALAALARQVRVIEAEAERPALPPAQPQQLQQPKTEALPPEPLGWNLNGHQARK
jgi:hypothetical protein